MAKQKDWIFRSSLALSGFFLAASLAAGLILVSRSFGADVVPPSAINPLPGEQGAAAAWLAALLFLAGALFLFARWYHLQNVTMWPSAGCPSCQNESLVRIRRTTADRALSFTGIPTGRYLCTECRWRGGRVPRGPVHLTNMIGPQESTAEFDAIFSERRKYRPIDPGTSAPQTLPVSGTPGVGGSHAALNGSAASFRHQVPNGEDNNAGTAGPLGLKLREEPHLDRPPSSFIEPGDAVVILDRVKEGNGHTWQLVQANGHKGWVIGMFVQGQDTVRLAAPPGSRPDHA